MRKYLPKEDKLQHYFVGSLIFIAFSIIVPNWFAVLMTTFFAVAWELYRQYFKGYKFDVLDVVYSILLGVLITVKGFI